MSIIDDAYERGTQRLASFKPIDYERMNRVRPKQKAALTRAVKAYRKAEESKERWEDDTQAIRDAREKVAQVCKEAVEEWNEIGAWPDDWATWQVALNDALPWNTPIALEDL